MKPGNVWHVENTWDIQEKESLVEEETLERCYERRDRMKPDLEGF